MSTVFAILEDELDPGAIRIGEEELQRRAVGKRVYLERDCGLAKSRRIAALADATNAT